MATPTPLEASVRDGIKISRSKDIGICEDCGSEEGRRRRTFRIVTVGGQPMKVDAWLCPSCRGAALATTWAEDR